MNRFKKEEVKRGEEYPSGELSEAEYRELINAKKEGRKPELKKVRTKELERTKSKD